MITVGTPPSGWEPPSGSDWWETQRQRPGGPPQQPRPSTPPPFPPPQSGGPYPPPQSGSPYPPPQQPSTPQPFPPPQPIPPTQPPAPSAPSAPRRRRTALIAGVTLATLVFVGLSAAAITLTVQDSRKEKPRDTLLKAASALGSARMLTYSGTISSTTQTLTGRVKVTKGGRAYGPISWSGTDATMLAADGHVFLKEPKSAWMSRMQVGTTDAALLPDGDYWGAVDTTELGIDFKGALSPPAMASVLRRYAGLRTTRSETTARGRKAIKISASDAAFYISRTGGHELLRYELSFPKIAADVTAQPVSAGPAAVSDVMADLGRLGDAFDASRHAKVAAKPEFTSCGTFGRPCTVSVKVQPDENSPGPARVRAYFRLASAQNGGGKVFGDCQATGVVAAGQSQPVTCTISGGEWARHGADYKTVWVYTAPFQLAVQPQDVPRMQHDLANE
ncbi:hypothetical protein [Actinomadura rupiterrae]|uniref:hypothetical protein n=1 Tax=Actinomadura rupiterrae TaxID=559627 RepID=UPI0020A4DE20|nr:hypothetical protein [Actinomadura rupiterrae]MCP2343409.1 hypothetical protein [Actinomadura rupiterrae]